MRTNYLYICSLKRHTCAHVLMSEGVASLASQPGCKWPLGDYSVKQRWTSQRPRGLGAAPKAAMGWVPSVLLSRPAHSPALLYVTQA